MTRYLHYFAMNITFISVEQPTFLILRSNGEIAGLEICSPLLIGSALPRLNLSLSFQWHWAVAYTNSFYAHLIFTLSYQLYRPHTCFKESRRNRSARLYSPGGSVGLTVWLQFAIACFGWGVRNSNVDSLSTPVRTLTLPFGDQ